LKRFFSQGVFILLTLSLFACTPKASDPSATSAARLEAGSTPEVDRSAGTVSAPQGLPAPETVETANLLVVYPKADGLWIWKGAAAPVQLTNVSADAHPRLSADGQLVLFQRGGELWTVEISGQNPRRVYGEAGTVPLQVEFAPASQKIYFTTSADGKPRFDLNLVEGGVSKNLLPAGQGGQFTFTPDGQLLALVQPNKILTVRADGSAVQLVYQFQPVKASGGAALPQIAWLENGFGFKTVIPGSEGQPARLLFLMAAGGTPAQLAVFPAVPPSVSQTFIAPDGSRVLYLREQGGDLELHVIDASTADKLYFKHPRGQIGLLGWTPDSKGLLFWLDDPRRAWMASGETRLPSSDVAYAENVTWVEAETCLFLNGAELRVRQLGQPSQLIDTGVTGPFAVLNIR
jgi:hypothetical protein